MIPDDQFVDCGLG